MPEGTTAVTLMLDLLSKILRLEVFWGIIIGSGLTILGAFLANRHDAKQREKDRKLSLRRDVYLSAADSILKAQNLIMQLLDPATPLKKVASQLPKELYVISRALVVGSDKTIRSVLMILDSLGDTYETIVFKRATLMNPAEYLDITELGINECEKLFQLIPPALVAIREELELPFDQDAFSKLYTNNAKKRKDSLQAKIDAIRDGEFYHEE